MDPLIIILLFEFVGRIYSLSMAGINMSSINPAVAVPDIKSRNRYEIVDKNLKRLQEEEEVPKKACRSAAPAFRKIPVDEKTNHNFVLCGNTNKDDDRCFYSCVAGGFYHGVCNSADECYCYRNNPDKGFIIEKKQPVIRNVKPKNGNSNVKSDVNSQNPKEITLVTDDYITGYVDVDVNVNMEWDLSEINEWFQSFNFYNNLKCDPCLCPAGCAIYGYFSGYCTPPPDSECMCATATRKPKDLKIE